jgi:diguanylate cyclase (GGDEF)-like protein
MLTEAQWDNAERRRIHTGRVSGVVGTLCTGLLNVPTMALGLEFGSGAWRYVIAYAASVVIGAPLVAIMIRINERQNAKTDENLRKMAHQLHEAVARADHEVAHRDAQASRQKFESRLANALDMAEGEPEVLDVIERSLTSVLPDTAAELLLADNSQAHLVRMAGVGFREDQAGCPVTSPNHCPAARRAQIQVFEDSHDLDSCPKLRHRCEDRLSALCVPVSIMGRTVGVIHTTGPAPTVPSEERVQDLATLAKLAGARIGLLRAMAETQLQATTDNLTGLLNRRSFEERIAEARRSHSLISIAMADLDHFKELNDTYGHETGDRALRLFARVLRDSLRADDLVCRHGGEEFVVAFPGCSAPDAQRALEAVCSRLDAALTVNGLPSFTASFGLIEMASHDDLSAALARADEALFSAKRQGRNRIVADAHPSEGRVPETLANS